MMKRDSPLWGAYAGLVSTAVIRSWMGTLDFQAALYDPRVDPATAGCRGKNIYIFWHEYILFPFHLRHHCNLAMLLSRHRDADVLNQAARLTGFGVVRGSTRRGGVAAIRALLDRSRDMHLAITPDGPRGPRRRLAPGAVYLASKLGLPLVLLGLGYDRPWRVNSWDRFAVPRPGSRARGVTSPEIRVPGGLDRAGLEHYRRRIEQLLNRLTSEAEAWAASGTRKRGQHPVRPGPARPRTRRGPETGARVCPLPGDAAKSTPDRSGKAA